jgi:hypothetical protein
MATRQRFVLSATALILALAAGTAVAQEPSEPLGGPFTLVPVLNAPFVADMTVTVSQAGTVKKATARYFRDSQGRVRVEYEAPSPRRANAPMIAVKPEPEGRLGYMVDPVAKAIRPAPIGGGLHSIFNGGATVSIPISPTWFRQFVAADGLRDATVLSESLGTREISGITTIGRRVGENDERWESAELKLVIYSHRIDAKTGADIEYRLTKISRTEPSPDLFVVPEDYTRVQGTKEEPLVGIRWKD